MDTLIPALVAAGFTLFGLVAFINGFSLMHRLRLVRDIPRSDIRSIAMGLVEIHGRVRAGQTVETPISGVECVHYKYELQKYVQSKNGGHWRTVAEGQRGMPFYAVDETGEVLVDPTGAQFNYDVRRQYKVKTGLFQGLGAVRDFLDAWDRGVRTGLRSGDWEVEEQEIDGWLFNSGNKRIREYFVTDNDTIYVMGTAVRYPNEPRRIRIAGTDSEETPFLISNRSERELASKLKQKMLINFVVGGLMLTLGITFLLYLADLI